MPSPTSHSTASNVLCQPSSDKRYVFLKNLIICSLALNMDSTAGKGKGGKGLLKKRKRKLPESVCEVSHQRICFSCFLQFIGTFSSLFPSHTLPLSEEILKKLLVSFTSQQKLFLDCREQEQQPSLQEIIRDLGIENFEQE